MKYILMVGETDCRYIYGIFDTFVQAKEAYDGLYKIFFSLEPFYAECLELEENNGSKERILFLERMLYDPEFVRDNKELYENEYFKRTGYQCKEDLVILGGNEKGLLFVFKDNYDSKEKYNSLVRHCA